MLDLVGLLWTPQYVVTGSSSVYCLSFSLDHLGPCSTTLDHLRPPWTIFDNLGPSSTRFVRALLLVFGPCWTTFCHVGPGPAALIISISNSGRNYQSATPLLLALTDRPALLGLRRLHAVIVPLTPSPPRSPVCPSCLCSFATCAMPISLSPTVSMSPFAPKSATPRGCAKFALKL